MRDWLELYEAAGSICRYEFEGKRYLHVLNWSDHQKPQHPSKARIVPCPKHEAGAHKKWLGSARPSTHKVSGNPHEPLVSASPTSRGGGEVSLEMSEGDEGGPTQAAIDAAEAAVRAAKDKRTARTTRVTAGHVDDAQEEQA
jgi:hypothetical protein